MKRLFAVLALCGTVVLPVGAFAQAGPPGMGGPPSPPSPQQQEAMEKMRADAKASAYSALSPGHAASVQTKSAADEARKCAPAVMELYALLAKPKEEFGRLQDLENRNDEVFSLLQKIQRG